MTVNAITDTKKGEQGLRLLIYILPSIRLCACLLSVCPFVCRQNAYTKTRFSQKNKQFKVMVSIDDQ